MIGKPGGLDPLDYLPHRDVETFVAGAVVRFIAGLQVWLVVQGYAAVTHGDGVGRVLGPNDLWIGDTDPHLLALTELRLMRWSSADLESAASRHPRLGLALAAESAHQTAQLAARYVVDLRATLETRLGRALLDLAGRFGVSSQEEMVMARRFFTHAFLARCIGTSREVVTDRMCALRRRGLVAYNTREIVIRQPRELAEECGQELRSEARP